MQTNSSQWLRRMREKHRRLFWKKGLEDRFQVLQEGERVGREQESEKRIDQVQNNVKRKNQVQQTGKRVDQVLKTGNQKDIVQKTGNRNNVIPLEERRLVSSSKPHPHTIAELEADVWELRKQFILQIASRRNGKIRLQEVAAECNVNIRIAAEWLIRLSMEGMLSLVAGQRYTMTYSVKEVGAGQK
ncbi:hypothetical protein GC096_19695 [Paenibacillus sp. LMG 31461]|uniref:Uncharacterized protein n=1 Tax=Paenibacillus plantarum TaxID=2654975 RepID=A0ABX1XCS6_9BACL|nr:hypothetical protein [Paenibacillus plantarum]NOU66267.1 hypothetical protein [Paenibacillus plantarum]